MFKNLKTMQLTGVFVLCILAGCTGRESQLGGVLRDELLTKLQEGESELNLPEHKIVGGWSASTGMIPYQAIISLYRINSRNAATCGGSLITRRHILTVAHCLENMEGGIVSLGSSSWGMFGPGIRSFLVEANNFIIHPDYDDVELVNDIGIIRLPSFVALSFTIKPVSLPTDNMTETNFFAGKTGSISGFGMTSDDFWGSSESTKLQMAYVNITRLEKCKKVWSKLIEIQKTHICTSSRPASTCQGDSGGPLVVNDNGKDYLIGLTSFGDSRCVPSSIPSVYTNVASYLPWIHSIIKIN